MTSNYSKQRTEVAWMQITAGQGPKECGWVVSQLLRKVVKAALDASLSVDIIETLAFDKALRKQNLVEPDAYLSALIRIEGGGVNNFAQSWQGSIKWQGESPYRPKHKRCNWFAGIELVTATPSDRFELATLAREVELESMRSGGPGGQHVNKTNSAVRLTHRPSGIKIRVDTDRSQHRNRQLALERLQVILTTEGKEKEKAQDRKRWLNHYQVERGSPTRVFFGYDFIEKL
jgi:peptide chain release factor